MRIVKRRRKLPLYFLLIVILIGGYSAWALTRPLPLLQPSESQPVISKPAGPSRLSWPAEQAAVSVMDTDILETHGEQKPVPIASVAKVITCLVVLDKSPLEPGQTGLTYTLKEADVALFRNYAAQDGSLVPVAAGEKINQYQMLQAIMLPSANNLADSLAIATFGSLNAYSAAANAWLKKHGFNNTRVGSDASGMSPTTTSTAEELVKLGNLAMRNAVLSEIASQSTATGIPLTTTVKNYNSLLGQSSIVGIKTGNTDQAGGVFLSASRTMINGKQATIITAVAGAPNLQAALNHSLVLVRSAQANTSPVTVVKAGQVVGYYDVPWGDSVKVVAAGGLSAATWNGDNLAALVDLKPLPFNEQPTDQITLPENGITQKKVAKLRLERQPSEPSLWWRLSHPFYVEISRN